MNVWSNCCYLIVHFREEMILKLMRVLGVNEEKYRKDDESIDLTRIDPDDTYVFTIDNLMKMLAIHMKFRYWYF